MCSSCGRRDECTAICDDLERELDIKSGRELPIDPRLFEKVAYVSPDFTPKQKRKYLIYAVALMTVEQKRVMRMMAAGKTQSEIAAALKISQQAVSQRIQTIRAEITEGAVKFIDKVISESIDI